MPRQKGGVHHRDRYIPSCQLISLRRHELADDPDFAEGFADGCLEVWKEGDSEQ